MEQSLNKLGEISEELAEVKRQITESDNTRYFYSWIPRKKLMEFLDYDDTQIAALSKAGDLIVSEIGNSKFIKKGSVIRLLEKQIKKIISNELRKLFFCFYEILSSVFPDFYKEIQK